MGEPNDLVEHDLSRIDTVPNGQTCLEDQGFSDVHLMFTAVSGISTYRAKKGGKSYYVKVARSVDEQAILQLRGEWNMVMTLNAEAVPHTCLPVSWGAYGELAGMLFNDTGKRTLRELYCGRRSAEEIDWKLFLERIRRVCLTLEACHALDIRHGNIRPEVIFVDPTSCTSESDCVYLASWLFSSRLAVENPFPSSAILSASLSYVAPECTGRMNRNIDSRSDLYSLGVTLYESLCLQLPFTGSSTLEIMHKHISEVVPSPSTFCDLPKPLESLIMKLLKKTPDDRYQSATGLLHDIDSLLASYRDPSRILMSSIEIGKHDHASRFVVSADLVGREQEITVLTNLFDEMKRDARTRVATIGGYSGVGKSRLVKEVFQLVSRTDVFYTECKFDQYKSFAPFSTMKILISDLLSQVFVESPAILAQWRDRVIDALGMEARPVCDLCPDLVILLRSEYLDSLPPIVPLGALASEERLKRGLNRLIQVFASSQHQLIMFVDDAQWSPPADLQMLLSLREQSHTFIICAYRDNEIGPTHLLHTIFLSNISPDLALSLQALNYESTTRLIAATLHRPIPSKSPKDGRERELRDLVDLIYAQTQGNCFFISQVLTTLYRAGCFKFDFDSGLWTWRLSEILSQKLSDDVVDLVLRQVTTLTPSCQEILKTASCLGNSSFRLDILEISTLRDKHEIAQDIFGAMTTGLVVAVNENYKAALALGNADDWAGPRLSASTSSATSATAYAFLHDRVQQAVYALINDKDKQALHYSIGTRLLQAYGDNVTGAIGFDICNQVNRGKSLVQGADRLRLGRLNLRASRSAFDNTANDSALELLQHAAEFLPEDLWVVDANLAEEFFELKEEILASITDYDGALEASEIILTRTDNKVTKIRMYSKQIKALLSKGAVTDAIGVAAIALSAADIDFQRFLDGASSPEEIAEATSNLWNRVPSTPASIAALKDLPRLEDEASLAAADLLVTILPPIYFLAPTLIPLLILTGVNTSIERGVAGYSCYYFTFLGLMCCEADLHRCDFLLADAWNETGEALLEELITSDTRIAEQACATLTLTTCCHGFTRSSKVDGRRASNLAIELGSRCFDGEYIAYALGNSAVGRLHEGEDLRQVYSELHKHVSVVQSYKRDLGSFYAFPTIQCMANLLYSQELADLPNLSGKLLQDETIALETMETSAMTLHICYYWLAKLLLTTISRDLSGALMAARKAITARNAASGLPGKAFIEFLSMLAMFDMKHADQSLEIDDCNYLAEIGKHVQIWGHQNARNFGAWVHIWNAESNLTELSLSEIIEQYDAAINKVKSIGNSMLLGIFSERCARCIIRQKYGFRLAHGYLLESVSAYFNWGCSVKAKAIVQEFNLEASLGLAVQLSAPADSSTLRRGSLELLSGLSSDIGKHDFVAPHNTSTSQLSKVNSESDNSAELDLAMVVRNSLLLSKAFHANDIVPQLLNHLLQVAGAQFAALVVEDKDKRFVLSATARAKDVRLYKNLYLEQAVDMIPIELVRLATNRKRAIIDEHKYMKHRNHKDAILNTGHELIIQPKSFVVLPVLLSGRVVAVAYLSNDQVPNLFSEKKVELLTILATQASVSLEKLRMYTELKVANNRLEDHTGQLEAIVEERTKQLRNQNLTLSSEIERRTKIEAELVHAKEAAEQATAMKSRFLATMSHELRTPFNAVIGFSTLLLDTELSVDQRDMAQSIVDASTDQVAVINDILDFSKIESDKMKLDPIWFDLRALIESTLEVVAGSANSKDLDIAYLEDQSKVAAWIFADNTRLRQCVLNLLSNAIKFTPKNGSVCIRTDLELIGEAEAGGDQEALLQITVQDSGIGIAQQDLRKLFKFFSQVDDSTTRRFGGTGLGLAISKRICQIFSGDLSVESEPDKGSLFKGTFRLKVNRKTHPTEQIRSKTLEKKRCLILEPAVLVRQSLEEHLKAFGINYIVRTGLDDVRKSDRCDVAIIGDSFNQPETIRYLRKRDWFVERLSVVVLMPFGATLPMQPAQKDLDAIDAVVSAPVRRVRLFRSLQSLFPDETGVAQFAKPNQQNLKTITNPGNSFPRKDISLLLVEDNLVNVKVATQLLKRSGYVPKVCHDGIEAIAACNSEHFDLIFMDLSMPRMGGLEATREIRAAEQSTTLKSFICAMTANAMSGDRERCIEAGMDDYITKPVMLPALKHVLDKARDIVTGTLEGVSRIVQVDHTKLVHRGEMKEAVENRREALQQRMGSDFRGISTQVLVAEDP